MTDITVYNIDLDMLDDQSRKLNTIIADMGKDMSDDEFDALVGLQNMIDSIFDNYRLDQALKD